MNMMNKCAKLHKDSPSGKKFKFNLPSAINTIEPEAEFLSEIRPSVVPEAKPRALREV